MTECSLASYVLAVWAADASALSPLAQPLVGAPLHTRAGVLDIESIQRTEVLQFVRSLAHPPAGPSTMPGVLAALASTVGAAAAALAVPGPVYAPLGPNAGSAAAPVPNAPQVPPAVASAVAFSWFQPHRLAYAALLADVGLLNEALAFCDSIAHVLKLWPKGVPAPPAYSVAFFNTLTDLDGRLRAAGASSVVADALAASAPASASGASSWLKLDGLKGLLERGLDMVVGDGKGDIAAPAAAAAAAGNAAGGLGPAGRRPSGGVGPVPPGAVAAPPAGPKLASSWAVAGRLASVDGTPSAGAAKPEATGVPPSVEARDPVVPTGAAHSTAPATAAVQPPPSFPAPAPAPAALSQPMTTGTSPTSLTPVAAVRDKVSKETTTTVPKKDEAKKDEVKKDEGKEGEAKDGDNAAAAGSTSLLQMVGGFFGFGKPKNVVKLGEPISLDYDPVQKRWINKKDPDANKPPSPPPPPPTAGFVRESSSMTLPEASTPADTSAPIVAPVPVSTAAPGATAGPLARASSSSLTLASTSPGPARAGPPRRGSARNRYVDVMNPGATSTAGTGAAAVPLPSALAVKPMQPMLVDAGAVPLPPDPTAGGAGVGGGGNNGGGNGGEAYQSYYGAGGNFDAEVQSYQHTLQSAASADGVDGADGGPGHAT